MEFPFRLPTSIGAPPGHTGPYIGCLDDKFLRGMTNNLMTVLDTLGKKSAVAQGLKKPVTYGSACSLLGQRIYLMVEDKCALGFIKVGTKRLFVAPPPLHAARGNHTDVRDALKEISPACVLDFYVHESCQRTGLGKCLFDTMLAQEGLGASQLAYDRPSAKFLPFLRKHFGLSRYTPQNNNFVIFDEFYGRSSNVDSSRSSRRVRSEGVMEMGYGGFTGRGILPTALAAEPPGIHRPPSNTQRPPLPPCPPAFGATSSSAHAVPGGRNMEVEMSGGNGTCGSSAGRPPSLGSNSRPPLGVASFNQQGDNGAIATMQTPWGTLGDVPTKPSRHVSNSRVSSSSVSPSCMEGSMAAGMRLADRSQGRSTSLPCRGHARSENPLTGGFMGDMGLGSSGSSAASGNRRYASPLSHAGHRMLAH